LANNFPISPDIRVSDIFFRTLAGAFGGIFGSAVILVGLFLSSSISATTFIADAGEINPLFTFISIVIIYLAILVSTLSSQTFFYFANREKYQFLLSSLSHSFSVITLIFLSAAPLSIIVSATNLEAISVIGLIQLGVATVFCTVIQESMAQSKHIILTMYSSTIALFFFLLLCLLIYFAIQTTSFLVILAFPIAWASIGFWHVASEMIYQWIYGLYGKDFLNAETKVGSDYIKNSKN
jgi:hypothetical protein